MQPTDTAYRPDIDGLRGLAVLAVVGFHASPYRLPGGFVGVDVFFVISGFLITGFILHGIESGSFSFWEFYARRIRRIFPALIIVLLATMALGWRVLFPDEYEQLARHVVAGSLFASNFVLWSEAGYFDRAAGLKPLLHLWSLGVEEQFYLVWPVTLVAVWKLRRKRLFVLAAIALASFALNAILLASDPTATFYSPLTRLWEPLIGALLAIFVRREDLMLTIASRVSASRLLATFRDTASALGLALVVGSIIFLSKNVPFPGWYGLVPTIGTACIIAAGPAAWVNHRLLSNRLVVYVGLISYPLYLWHWPLLTFATEYGPDDETLVRTLRLAALGSSFVAAAMTYHVIERPLRKIRARTIAAKLSVAMLGTAIVGAAIVFAAGVPSRYPSFVQQLIQDQHREALAQAGFLREGACLLEPEQTEASFSKACRALERPAIFLWGDSYAATLYPGLRKLVDRPEAEISQYTAATCPPVIGFQWALRPHCRGINESVLLKVESQAPKVIVLSAAWHAYYKTPDFMKLLTITLERLKANNEVVLVGPIVTFPKYQVKYADQVSGGESARNDLLPQLREIDVALRDIAMREGVRYVSPIATLCADDKCRIVLVDQGVRRLFSFDDGHLTRAGSDFYAMSLIGPAIQPTPLPSASSRKPTREIRKYDK